MKIPDVRFPIFIPVCTPIGMTATNRTLFRLINDFIFFIGMKRFHVPSGFVFDCASIPYGVRNTFNPSDTRYIASSLIHDWLYAGEWCNRSYADLVFLSALKYQGISAIKRYVMYKAVSVFGGLTYKEHSESTIKNIRRLSGVSNLSRPFSRELESW